MPGVRWRVAVDAGGSGRQADQADLPRIATLLTARSLFALARDPDVESRLVLAPAGVPPPLQVPPRAGTAGWRLAAAPRPLQPPAAPAATGLDACSSRASTFTCLRPEP